MSFIGDTIAYGKPTGALDPTLVQAGLVTYLAPDPAIPDYYINVRLTNGSGFYTAGGTSVSGGGVLTADQGSPGLLSNAWPVKLTDGVTVFGTPASPMTVQLFSGTFGSREDRPLWVTGSVLVINPSTGGVTTVITGSVSLTEPVVISNTVAVTGTVALARGVDVITLPRVTGSVALTEPVVVSNLVSVTGSVSIWGASTVTGTVVLARGVDVSSMPASAQGTPAGLGSPWPVILVSGSDVVGTQTHPTWVTGSVYVINPSGGSGGPITGSVALTEPVVVSNIISVTGTVHLTDVSAMTGTVVIGRAIDIATMPNLSVTNVVSVTGTVHLADVSSITGTVALARGVDILTMPLTAVTGSVSVWGVTTITGTVHLADVSAVTGTVALARGVDIISMPLTNVTGSVSIWGISSVTGTVHLADVSAITGTVALARAVDVATMPNLSVTNTVSVTGSVSIWGVSSVTGSVSLSKGVDVSTLPAIAQGTAAALSAPWRVQLVSGSDVVGQTTNPLWVTGSVYVVNQGGTGANVTTLTGSVVAILNAGNPVATSNPLPVTGSVSLSRGVDVVSMPLSTQLPVALVGARLDINNGSWFGSTAPTVGQKTMADSIPVVQASDSLVTSTSGTINAGTASVSMALNGRSVASVSLSPTSFVGSVRVIWSPNNGASFVGGGLFMATTSTPTTTLVDGNANGSYMVLIPNGATHIGINSLTYTSGSINVVLNTTAAAPTFTPSLSAAGTALPSHRNVLGMQTTLGLVHTPTVYNLASSGTEYVAGVSLRRTGIISAELIGPASKADSIPVTIATDQPALTLERATTGDPVGVIVSTAAVQILALNATAKSRIITNNGTSNIYLGRANTVTATGVTMGIWLKPGGSYNDSGEDLYTGAIFGIGDAVAASHNVSAWERT